MLLPFDIHEDYDGDTHTKQPKNRDSLTTYSRASTACESTGEATPVALKNGCLTDSTFSMPAITEEPVSGSCEKSLSDFDILKLLSANQSNKVFIVREKGSDELLVMKVMLQGTPIEVI